LSDFESILDKYQDKKVIIGGDMNIDLLSQDVKTLQYLDLLSSYNIQKSNKAITRKASKTIIYYVLSLNFEQSVKTVTST